MLDVINGFGLGCGKPLASSNRIGKIAFTGETATGRLISQYASQNLIRVTFELGRKSPYIFFADVMSRDGFLDKALEGFAMFALNQGELCKCPSRAVVHESIYEPSMERAIKRIAALTLSSPLDMATMIGAQASSEQLEKVLAFLDIGKKEDVKVLIGGERNMHVARRTGRRLLRKADGVHGA